MNPFATLRRIAEISKNPEIRDLAMRLAAELETQHNAQNNAFQAALSSAELGLFNQLDEILRRLDMGDARQHQILQMLEDVQTAIHEISRRVNHLEGSSDGSAG